MKKERKNFFHGEKDVLNKGYSRHNEDIDILRKGYNFLPSIEVVHSYEEIFPGALKKILEIISEEHKIQSEMEKYKLKQLLRSKISGNVACVVVIGIISFSVIRMVFLGMEKLAMYFATLAFISIFLLSIVIFFIECKKSKFRKSKSHYYRKNKN